MPCHMQLLCMHALMIYHWSTHADSKKCDILDTVLNDYLKMKDSNIKRLLAITKKGRFLNIDDDVEIVGRSVGITWDAQTELP